MLELIVGMVVVTGAGLMGPDGVTAGASTAAARASVPAGTADDAEMDLRFAYAGGQAGRDAIATAIDEAIADMNGLIRGMARKRLLEVNAVIESMAFSLESDPVVTTYLNGRIIAAPRSGKSVPWTDQFGERIQVSHRYADGKLVQTMRGAKGQRKNVYRFSEDGKTMTMSVEIVADQLPAAIRYQVKYRRG